jgi:hypothetical protein
VREETVPLAPSRPTMRGNNQELDVNSRTIWFKSENMRSIHIQEAQKKETHVSCGLSNED